MENCIKNKKRNWPKEGDGENETIGNNSQLTGGESLRGRDGEGERRRNNSCRKVTKGRKD